jgi:hypothetical protein
MVVEILYSTESIFCKTLSMDMENIWMVVFVVRLYVGTGKPFVVVTLIYSITKYQAWHTKGLNQQQIDNVSFVIKYNLNHLFFTTFYFSKKSTVKCTQEILMVLCEL